MKTILAFLFLCAAAFSQVVGPGYVNYVTSAPSGACSQGSYQQVVLGSGAIYTCQNGTWTQVGSAQGTVTSVTGSTPIASSGGATPAISFDATGLAALTSYATDSGSANAVVIGVPSWYPASATLGSCVQFKAAAGSTGATTINITPSGGSAYGAIALDKRTTAGVAVLGASGDIVTGGLYKACYDGTEWVLESPSSVVMAGGALTSAGLIRGNSANQVSGSSNISSDGVILTKYNSVNTTGVGATAVYASPSVITIGSGSSIGNTSLCSTALCPAGTYVINTYIDITTACSTGGTYQVNFLYTDDAGAKTVVANINGTGATPATGALTLASTSNFGEDTQVVRTTGAANNGLGSINYSTTAVAACATGGPAVGNLYLSVTRVQ